MDFKRTLMISLLLITILALASTVSAGLFDGSAAVNGVKFNIPDGFYERGNDNVADNYLNMGYNGECGVYRDDLGNMIYIDVLDQNPEGTALSLSDVIYPAFDFYDLDNTADIAGKRGISYKYNTTFGVMKAFVYLENGKLIDIQVPDSVNFEDIII